LLGELLGRARRGGLCNRLLRRNLDLYHGARPGALGAGDGHDLLPDLHLKLHTGGHARRDLHLHHLHLD
jgi:hypothetical protein